MLPKENRLSGAKTLLAIKKKGKYFAGDFFALVTTKEPMEGKPKFAFVVSNKISRKATERNRMKRLLRAAVAKYRKQVKEDVMVVVLAKRNFSDKKEAEIENKLGGLLDEASLLKTLNHD